MDLNGTSDYLAGNSLRVAGSGRMSSEIPYALVTSNVTAVPEALRRRIVVVHGLSGAIVQVAVVGSGHSLEQTS